MHENASRLLALLRLTVKVRDPLVGKRPKFIWGNGKLRTVYELQLNMLDALTTTLDSELLFIVEDETAMHEYLDSIRLIFSDILGQ